MNSSNAELLFEKYCPKAGQLFGTCPDARRPSGCDEAAAHTASGLAPVRWSEARSQMRDTRQMIGSRLSPNQTGDDDYGVAVSRNGLPFSLMLRIIRLGVPA